MIRIKLLDTKEGQPGLVFDCILKLNQRDGKACMVGCFHLGDKCSGLVQMGAVDNASTALRAMFVQTCFGRLGWSMERLPEIDYYNTNLFEQKVTEVGAENTALFDRLILFYHVELLKEVLKGFEMSELERQYTAPYQALTLLRRYREWSLQAQGQFAQLNERIQHQGEEIQKLENALTLASGANAQLEKQWEESRTNQADLTNQADGGEMVHRRRRSEQKETKGSKA